MKFDYIKCHGSGNEFVMFDAVAQNMGGVNLSQLSIELCDRTTGIGADGILLLVRDSNNLYGMRMFNPDGSEAEMCGNGIRCIARLAEQYIGSREFDLTSGGKVYPTARYAPIFGDIPTYGVQIGVKLWSKDFSFSQSEGCDFIGKVIERFSGGSVPVIAGGLIETKAEVTSALASGAAGVSTGMPELWYI